MGGKPEALLARNEPQKTPNNVTFMTAATPMRRQALGCCQVGRTNLIKSPANLV
jgi:hypothetical protein